MLVSEATKVGAGPALNAQGGTVHPPVELGSAAPPAPDLPGEADSLAPAGPAAEAAAPAEGAPGEEEAPKKPERRHFTDDVRNAIVSRRREFDDAHRNDPTSVELRSSTEQAMGAPTIIEAVDDASAAASGGPSAPAPAAAAAPASAAPAAFTRVVINGQQLDVPTEEVNAAGGLSAYQMGKAAEATFRNVKALENQLRDRLSAAPPTTAAGPASAGQPAAPAGPAVDLTEVALELHEGVLDANKEKMASALAKIASMRQQAPAAPAAQAAVVRTPEEIQAANAVFKSEFPGLKEGVPAFEEARRQIVERIRDPAYSAFPLQMLVRDIGSRLSTIAGTSAAAPAAPATPAGPPSVQDRLQQRLDAKARLPMGTTSGARLSPAAPAAPIAPTVKAASYIQSLRARSGSNTSVAERAAR